MRQFRAAALALAFAAVLPLPGLHAWEIRELPDEMLLETFGDNVLDAQHCDNLHVVKTCQTMHYQPTTATRVGAIVRLDNTLYVIEWMGPGYYLESGAILHAVGPTAPELAGQQWVEAHPREGTIHISRAWRDLDTDGFLNRSDTLVLDSGRELKVRDVRLNLRVRRLRVE